jgi:ribosomal protein S12 methylthiotransferase
MSMHGTASLVSLGCAKNLVDSEAMISQLLRLGYAMESDPSRASLILVNTCGFLESAVKEAVDTVLQLALHKESGVCQTLVVAGCMVQRYGKKLLAILPEVDVFLGTSHFHELGAVLLARGSGDTRRLWIAPPRSLPTNETARTISTGPVSAYLKIAEGCGNHCAFCMIPRLRGPYRSRSVEDVVAEASRLAREGIKEINLIAQDTTAFGSDRGERQALPRLLEALDRVEGVEWIRLLYAYPDRISRPLLQTLAQSGKVVPYLDIPLQHCVPRILESMGRATPEGGQVEELIDLLRGSIPNLALRTSLMVGFPGETEEDFQALVRFVERVQFDHAGVFSFSAEKGSRAARLAGQVDKKTKGKRHRTLLRVQRNISRRLLKRHVGTILPVLIEGLHPETELLLAGRLSTQAPEVDGSVLITAGTANPGQIVPVSITDTYDYDLQGEIL